MHPNPLFRNDDRALHEALIDEIGFGMVYAQTPDGPRVGHTPILSTGDGAVQFHLSRGNALAKYLAGETALMVVNGPDAYISPRWYDDPNQVPTWDYVSLELEGRVRMMDSEGLVTMLDTLTARFEARVPQGEPWSREQMEDTKFQSLLRGITGFEMEISAWRSTLKLSQNKPSEVRAKLADHLDKQGQPAIAQLMRTLLE